MPIVIVDDSPANLKVARFALESEGYEVHTASDAEEALLLLREVRPRLILMDLQLPGMDGLQLTRHLKADAATHDIVIVAVTAYAMKGDRERALLAGCDGYITKPIDPILLPTQVAELLALSDRRPAVPAHLRMTISEPRHDNANEAASGASAISNELFQGSNQKILLIEDNPATRRMYRLALESAGYDVIEAQDGAAALTALRRLRPDLIILDLVLPDIDGLDLTRKIREELGAEQIPILCVSGSLSRLDEAQGQAATYGFAQALMKPVDPFVLLGAVKTHLASPATFLEPMGNGRLLIVVDDDPQEGKLAEVWFSSAGFNVLLARDGEEALELVRRKRPAAVISDVLMPKMDGFSLCASIRCDPELVGLPVILTSSAYTEKADHDLARRAGASAFLLKSDGLDEVVRALTEALDDPPQAAMNEPDDQLELDHARRAHAQLGRKTLENAALLQRSTLQEAQLAVLAKVARALAENLPVDKVLGDVLAFSLDMAGASKGALFRMKAAGTLELRSQFGFSDSENRWLRDRCGQTDLFVLIANRGRVVALPSAAFRSDVAQQFMIEAGVTSLLVIPLMSGTETYGAMLLGARYTDLSHEEALAFGRVLGAQMDQALALAQAFEKLGASELRYRTLTENANDAICILTPAGVIREVNHRLTEILGYPVEQIIGRNMREFAPPGRADENVNRYQSSLAQGEKSAQRYEIRKQDGDIAIMDFSTAAVDIGGEQLVLSIGRDVTEQVRTQGQLMVSYRLASVGMLAAGVAHEINNPLTAVLGNLDFAAAEIAQQTSEAGASRFMTGLAASISDAREAGDRVKEIVKDLKIFSREERECSGAVDTQKVLESTLRIASNEIRHRARLVKSYGDVPLVQANESRLGQVFLNLIVNAAQAIPEGHADINEIRVITSKDASGRVVVEIQDTGPGIAPETLKHLFTPFFTTKPVGVGTGLGLAICHRIVTGTGGEITVQSQVGVGTTFRVSLLAASSEEVKDADKALETPPLQRRGRILIIDDEPMIIGLADRILSKEHDVKSFSSAKEALTCIMSTPHFDVILCDMMMPVMTGMEFYDELVKVAPEQASRVVFLTGGVFTPKAREFLDRIPNTRIDKPIDIQNVRTLVNSRIC